MLHDLTPWDMAPRVPGVVIRTTLPTLLLVGCALTSLRTTGATTELVNGYAVIVNEAVITLEDIQKAMAEEESLLRYQYSLQPRVLQERLATLRKSAADLLIERQLILHEFKTAGYQLPDSIIEDHINQTIRERFGDRLTLIRTLQNEGITYEAYKKKVREDFILAAMVRFHIGAEKILISPYKIETYYQEHVEEFQKEDEVHARMILLRFLPSRGPEATKRLAQEIVARIKQGASFAEMAAVYSDGAYKNEGGQYPWFDRKYLNEKLSEVAFSLAKGQVSDLIEMPDGIYLMKLEDRRDAHVQSLSQVRDVIEQKLKVQEEQRLRKAWIDKLMKKSFIQYFPSG